MLHFDVGDSAGFDAVDRNSVAVRIRSWAVEGDDATYLAKQVFGDSRVERVLAKPVLALGYPEALARHHEMDIALHETHGAIAVPTND